MFTNFVSFKHIMGAILFMFYSVFVELCKKRGVKPSAAAAAIGFNRSSITNWKNNGYTPRRDLLVKVAQYFNVSVDYLLGNEINLADIGEDIYSIKNIMPLPKTKIVPLLGSIACGSPILAEENIEIYLRIDENIPADFSLRCKGDSMINKYIFDGDIVFIRRQSDVDDGEVAAVLIGDEATLKVVRKYPDKGKIILSPCNPKYDDLIYSGEQLDDVKILGKAVAYIGAVR